MYVLNFVWPLLYWNQLTMCCLLIQNALNSIGRLLFRNQDAIGQFLVRNNHVNSLFFLLLQLNVSIHSDSLQIRELEKLKRTLSSNVIPGTYLTGLKAVHKELILKR